MNTSDEVQNESQCSISADCKPSEENDSSPIRVAFCVDVQGAGANQFIDMLLVALYSLRQTGDLLDVSVFAGHLPVETCAAISALETDAFRVKVRSFPQGWLQRWQSYVPNNSPTALVRTWSGITFARYWLSALMPEADRVIYVDADILVRKSLRPLWEFDLGDALLGAPFGTVPEHGYYSGCLLMNLAGIRKGKDILAQLDAYALKEAHRFKLPDQTTMNRFFAGKIKEIDSSWIYPPAPGKQDRVSLGNAPMWHFYEGGKPQREPMDDWHVGERIWRETLKAAEKTIAGK